MMKNKIMFTSSLTILAVFAAACAYAGQSLVADQYPASAGKYRNLYIYGAGRNGYLNVPNFTHFLNGEIDIDSGTVDSSGTLTSSGTAAINFANGSTTYWSIYKDSSERLKIANGPSGASPVMTLSPSPTPSNSWGNSTGINTDNPQATLDVFGGIRFGNSLGYGRGALYVVSPGTYNSTGSAGDSFEVVLTANNGAMGAYDEVWIGSNPPGSAYNGRINLCAKAIAFYGTDSASFTCNGSQVLTSSSDIRLKKDVVTIPDALDRVCRLRGVNFKWKDKDRDKSLQMGVVAQEAEKVFPEAVTISTDSGMKSVDYKGLVGALIEATKELKNKADGIKKEGDSLYNRTALLEARAG